MGTNYYWHQAGIVDCVCGAHRHDVIHLGKSSAGWAFCFRVYDDPDGKYRLPDSQAWREWMESLPHGVILDEYGRRTSVPAFWEMVDKPERKAMLDCMRMDGREPSDFDFRDQHGHRCSRVDFS